MGVALIPILIFKIGDFQLPPKSDSFFVQLVLMATRSKEDHN